MAWLYVPGREGSSLDSVSPSPDTELWVTSSGKALQRQLSWRGWKTRPWIRRLFGTISDPSTAARGVESWISSLRVFRVSRSALPAINEAPKTSVGSGPSSSASFGRFNPGGSFSKTSLDLFGTDSGPSSVDWPKSGTMQSGICSARKRSVPPTSGSGSSFSRGEYPTPSATPYGTSQNEGQVPHERPTAGTPSLETWAKTWGTPRVTTNSGIPAPEVTGKGSRLEDQAGTWPTWPTPTTGSGGPEPPDPEDGRGGNLKHAGERWPSPRAADSESAGNHPGAQDSLTGVLKNWPTPTEGDAKASGSRETSQSEAHDGMSLADAATRGHASGRHESSRSSLPALATSSCGPECSPKHRRLNPRFVEYLMGWPPSWTSVQTGSGPAGTELSLYRQRMRSSLWRIAPDGWRRFWGLSE